MKTEILKLNDDIVLTSSTGYEGRLSEAVIDVRKGNVVSDKPVDVKLLNGVLNAKRLEISDNGDADPFRRRRYDDAAAGPAGEGGQTQ